MKIETEKYKEALTDEDIEVWAEKEFGDSMVIPEIAAMAGAKAFRDGLIKHLEAITVGLNRRFNAVLARVTASIC